MIFDNISTQISTDPIFESVEINDITGDPFEYILSASYECALMESEINLTAIQMEYSYLREYGIEPIAEANVISTIFSAIKNAIVAAFKRIAEFFKNIFSSSETAISEQKKDIAKADNAESNTSAAPTLAFEKKDPDKINLHGYTYYNFTQVSNNLVKLFPDVICVDGIKQYIAEYQDYINSIEDPDRDALAKNTNNDAKEFEEKKINPLIGSIQKAKDSIKQTSQAILNSDDNKNIKDIQVTEFNECSFKAIISLCKKDVASVSAVRNEFKATFQKTKDILTKYKKIVEDAEKRATDMIAHITNKGSNVANNVKGNAMSRAISNMASSLNKVINLSDSALIDLNGSLGKIVMRQIRISNSLLKAAKAEYTKNL